MAMIGGQWVPDSAKGRSQLQYALFGLPQEQMKLEGAQRWNTAQQNIMPWLFGGGTTGAAGAGGAGGAATTGAAAPSWMNIDWTQPYTAQQMGTLRQSNLQNATDIAGAAKASTYSDLLRRGLAGDQMTSSAEGDAGFRNELLSRQLQNQGELNLLNAVTQRGDMLRGEQTNNWVRLLNALNPGSTGGTDWGSVFAQQQQAQAQNSAGLMQGLGGILGLLLGR